MSQSALAQNIGGSFNIWKALLADWSRKKREEKIEGKSAYWSIASRENALIQLFLPYNYLSPI